MTSDYNGFTGEYRNKVGQKINRMVKAGQMVIPNKCDICGQTKGVMVPHLEDYYQIQTAVPVCVCCHMILHSRFSRPNRWINLLHAVREGKMSPPYRSVYEYLQGNQGWFDEKESRGAIKNPKTWAEKLLMTKIDLTVQQGKLL